MKNLKTTIRTKLIRKVGSLYELRTLAAEDERYRRLAIVAAQNLGGTVKDLPAALRWLSLNADETTEAGVVAEVNYCRDLISEKEQS